MHRLTLLIAVLAACGDPVSPVEDVVVGTYELTQVTRWGSGATGELPFAIFFDVFVDSATISVNDDNTGVIVKYMRNTSLIEDRWVEEDHFVWTRVRSEIQVNDEALAQSKGINPSMCDFTMSLAGSTLVISRRNEDLHYPFCGEHERLQEEQYSPR